MLNYILSSWNKAKSFRKVIGLDFSKTFNNIVFQGEFAEMPKYNCLGLTSDLISDNSFSNILKEQFDCIKDSVLSFGNAPSAMVLNAYTQYDNVNFLILYRNYDLEFDNPYQRSFSIINGIKHLSRGYLLVRGPCLWIFIFWKPTATI